MYNYSLHAPWPRNFIKWAFFLENFTSNTPRKTNVLNSVFKVCCYLGIICKFDIAKWKSHFITIYVPFSCSLQLLAIFKSLKWQTIEIHLKIFMFALSWSNHECNIHFQYPFQNLILADCTTEIHIELTVKCLSFSFTLLSFNAKIIIEYKTIDKSARKWM